MKRKCLFALFFSIISSTISAESPEPCGPVPSQQQLEWQDMETYAFIHYSLNTYTDKEWGYGNEDPALFNPDKLDADQWAKVCKDAGMKGIIFTAKHHGGFCMWPSEYTDYSIKNSPWKDGKGDVVKELQEACEKHGLKFAVYLSPWDRNHKDYGKPEYIDYYRNQLTELLSNYGDIFEVWLDGANGGNGWYGGADEKRNIDKYTYYDWDNTFDLIRRLQPNAVIWNDRSKRGDLRWIGNENGVAGATNWSMMTAEGELSKEDLNEGFENGELWVPGEADVSIRKGWFFHENQAPKTLAELMDIYYKSVGRNSAMLLNFPVRPDGLIDRADSITGAAFGKYLKEMYKTNLAEGGTVSQDENQWIVKLDSPKEFNRLVVQEPIEYGQRVKSFLIEAYVDGEWIELKDELLSENEGLTTIGHKRIVCFPAVETDKVRLSVLDSKCEPLISNIALYLAPPIQEPL